MPFGYVAAWRVMPVERNTIYHLKPGSLGLTFGMFGCDLRCPWCSVAPPRVERVSAPELVSRARAAGCRIVVSPSTSP